MADLREQEMDQEILGFMACHGMAGRSDYYNYHAALGFYCAYSADAFRLAEIVEDGEIFDEYEVSAVIKKLYLSHKTLRYFQQQLNLRLYRFDTAETVVMTELKLEKGRIIGSRENAIETAQKWLNRFLRSGEPKYKKSSDEKGDALISQNFFLYEAAVFILYLAGEEIDYHFIMNKGNHGTTGGKANVYYGPGFETK